MGDMSAMASLTSPVAESTDDRFTALFGPGRSPYTEQASTHDFEPTYQVRERNRSRLGELFRRDGSDVLQAGDGQFVTGLIIKAMPGRPGTVLYRGCYRDRDELDRYLQRCNDFDTASMPSFFLDLDETNPKLWFVEFVLGKPAHYCGVPSVCLGDAPSVAQVLRAQSGH